MSPAEIGGQSRHYHGPDAAMGLPPAAELQPPPPPQVPPEFTPAAPLIQSAFEDWFSSTSSAESLRRGIQLNKADLLMAFAAGFEVALSLAPKGQPQVRQPEVPFRGTPETRTLVAALEFFLDNVLQHLPPEEQAKGEYMTVDEVKAYITQLRNTQ